MSAQGIDSMEEKKFRIAFTADRTLKKLLKHAANERDTSVQALLEEAARTYLNSPRETGAENSNHNPSDIPVKTGYTVPAEHQKWVEMLVEILESGNQKAISAVLPNLVAFYELVHLTRGETIGTPVSTPQNFTRAAQGFRRNAEQHKAVKKGVRERGAKPA